MTIDEHFILMVMLEALIFFVGMGLMYYQQKRTADMIEEIKDDPDILVTASFGIMEAITTDKEKQEIFFNFVQHCGAHAMAGARASLGEKVEAGLDLPKRHAMKPFEGILNQFLPGLFEKAIKGKAEKVVEAAVDGSGWG